MQSSMLNTAGRLGIGLLGVLLMATLAACGGADDGTAGDTNEQGELLVGLTDADGDFLAYTVDVTGLTLHQRSGATVQALPRTTRVDFSQYVEVTELLTAARVPTGTYERAEITLDFSDAEIIVQGDSGQALTAEVEDDGGNALTTMTVALELNGGSAFTIRPGQPALFSLDFDLAASNEIEIQGDQAAVTVDPMLVATTELEEGEDFRLRGLLGRIDNEARTFTVDLRPFRHRQGRFGEVTAHIGDGTSFEVDGQSYAAEAGLDALAELQAGAPVVTSGRFDTATRTYTATAVYAGSSVAWGEQDILRGSVVARNGNTLTVRGATAELDDGRYVFRDQVNVTLTAATTVTRQGDAANRYTIDDISVGQAITATGEMTADSSLDAGDGNVRLRHTSLTGSAASAAPLAVDLQRINGRHVTLYAFAGTGADTTSDADPDYYEVAAGHLDTRGIDIGDPLRVRGFVTAFGTAPEDFEAITVIDVSEVRARMVVGYGLGGSDMAVAGISEAGLLLDIGEAGSRHHLIQAGVATDLNTLAAVPTITPAAGQGVFAIGHRETVEVYTDFSGFQAALAAELDSGARVRAVHATGGYQAGDAALTSRHVRVRLAR